MTGLIHRFTRPFIEDDVIVRMINGRNWPRVGYLALPTANNVIHELSRSPASSHLLQLLEADNPDDAAIVMEANRLRELNPDLGHVVASLGQDRDTIKRKWEINRTRAANEGTWMHWTLEAYLNRAISAPDTPEFSLFKKLLPELHGLTTYRTEWTVYADSERLAGSIDFVARNESGEFVLCGWKRSKQLRLKYSSFGNQCMLPPLDYIPDAQGYHYRLQLNVYRYILQRYYQVKVASMWVVCLHPDNDGTPFLDNVPVMHDAITAMMRIQRQRLSNVSGMSVNDLHDMDPLGGMDLDDDSATFDDLLRMEEDVLDGESVGGIEGQMDVDAGGDGAVQSAACGPEPVLVDSDRMDTARSDGGDEDSTPPVAMTPGAGQTEST